VSMGPVDYDHPHVAATGLMYFDFTGADSRDASGNATGGVRLPYLETVADNKIIGAPAATYNGVEASIPPAPPFVYRNIGVQLAGSWIPFGADDLNERYPNHGKYVSAVANAAEYALQKGWILEEDKDAYVERASQCPIGKKKNNLTTDQIKACLR